MDYILKNTYTNIPSCISDALKELYIMQKKLQDETRNVVTQTKNLLSSYEQDVNSLRNEVNLGSMNFKLYCQTTTDKIESIKNSLQTEVHINNIKNEDWRSSIEKKIFEDTIGWEDGANHINKAIKQSETLQIEFKQLKEQINEQKIDKSQLKECFLNSCKQNADMINDLSKYLDVDELKKDNDKFKKDLEAVKRQDNQEKKQVKEMEEKISKEVSLCLKQVDNSVEQLSTYKKENDNYVSALYKLIFDVNKEFRDIKDEIDQRKKSVSLSTIDIHNNNNQQTQFTLNPSERQQQQQQGRYSQISPRNREDERVRELEERIKDLQSELNNVKSTRNNEKINIERLVEVKQCEFFEELNNHMQQTLENNTKNIQVTYIQPIMEQMMLNRRYQQLQKNQKQINDGNDNEEDMKHNSKSSIHKTTDEDHPFQKREQDTQYTLKTQTQNNYSSEAESQEEGEENKQSSLIRNKNNHIESVTSIGQVNEIIPTTLTSNPQQDLTKLTKQQQQQQQHNRNNSQASSNKEMIHKDMIDFVDVYKGKNVSPSDSPLKAKYSNNQNNNNKNNRTVASFKKRQSGDNYQNFIQNSQESQENVQQNLSFYTEDEEHLLNQICSSKNKNKFHISQRKSLQSSIMNRNTPKVSNNQYQNILNNTLPDLSFEQQSPVKKWPPLENTGIHQKITNINTKQLNSACYTVMSHAKQNKMSVLNLSLDFNNPNTQSNNQQQLPIIPAQNVSYSNQLSNQIPNLSLCQYGNKASVVRAQKFQISNNNQINLSNQQRPISQQQHRNSVGGIFNNKSAIKITTRPKTSQENIEIIGQKK